MFKDKLPQLLVYQLVTKALLLLSLVILRTIAGSLLWVAGKPAITSSDIPIFDEDMAGLVAFDNCPNRPIYIYHI
mgnify:CR=1 FL=1